MPALLIPLVLLMNGLAAGCMLGTLLGGWPLLAGLPDEGYVRTHAFFSGRYDPYMPICTLGTLLGDTVLAATVGDGWARSCFTTAALLALCTVVISFAKNVPVNRWIRTVDPDNLPAGFDATARRGQWGLWNKRRSVITMLALLSNCAALATLL